MGLPPSAWRWLALGALCALFFLVGMVISPIAGERLQGTPTPSEPQWERTSLFGPTAPQGVQAHLAQGWEVERTESVRYGTNTFPQYFLRRDTRKQWPTPAPTLTPTPTPVPDCQSSPSSIVRTVEFDIVRYRVDSNSLGFYVEGIIRNNCNVEQSATVLFTFYDQQGNNIGDTHDYLVGGLAPNEVKGFRTTSHYPSRPIANVQVTVRKR